MHYNPPFAREQRKSEAVLDKKGIPMYNQPFFFTSPSCLWTLFLRTRHLFFSPCFVWEWLLGIYPLKAYPLVIPAYYSSHWRQDISA